MKTEKIKKFFSSKTGRSVVIAASMLLIALAVYLNYRWFYDPASAIGYGKNNMSDTQKEGTGDTQKTDGTAGADYFSATGLVRQQSRDEALDVLKLISSDEEASAEARAAAAEKISKIAVDIQNEANIETLVKAKGFEDCVAVIGEDCVSVIVKAETLQANQAAQILSIAYETTGISPEKISIIQK